MVVSPDRQLHTMYILLQSISSLHANAVRWNPHFCSAPLLYMHQESQELRIHLNGNGLVKCNMVRDNKKTLLLLSTTLGFVLMVFLDQHGKHH